MKNEKKHSGKARANQGLQADIPEPNKIAVSTAFDFGGKNLTPYGGLFPVATMLEKLGFQKLVEDTLRVKRIPRVMTIYQFVLAMVLAIYIGFSRLNHIRFVAKDPMLTGVLKVASLPGQSVFWRFSASLHLSVAQQLLRLQRVLRERVWEAANVGLAAITVDTDTTVHTLYGNQMGGRKGYNPKNKGKKSYQPILTFLAETASTSRGSSATATGPTGSRLPVIWRKCLRPCPVASGASLRGPIPGSIAGERSQPTREPTQNSSWWRARPRGWWSICKPPTGSHLPRPMPTSSANSGTSRKAGAKPIDLSPCVTAMTTRSRKSASNINCSTPRNTSIGCSSPTWKTRSLRWCGSTISGLERRIS